MVARSERRRIRLVVEQGSDFVPPPGATVVGGTVRRSGTELVLLVSESLQLENAIPADEHSLREPS